MRLTGKPIHIHFPKLSHQKHLIKTLTMEHSRKASSPKHWFQDLFGFSEHSHQYTRPHEHIYKHLLFDSSSWTLQSLPADRIFHVGKFSRPTLASLREKGTDPANHKFGALILFITRFISI